MLKRLYGHELPFPQDLVLLQHGAICHADSLKRDLPKFVIYYDNGICSPCAVNRIMEYYSMFQFFQKKGIYPMILLGTATDDQYRTVVGILRARKYPVPVYIDRHDIYSSKKSLVPSDRRYHSWLLDSDNRVVLVGNPFNNNRLMSLYDSVINRLVD